MRKFRLALLAALNAIDELTTRITRWPVWALPLAFVINLVLLSILLIIGILAGITKPLDKES